MVDGVSPVSSAMHDTVPASQGRGILLAMSSVLRAQVSHPTLGTNGQNTGAFAASCGS